MRFHTPERVARGPDQGITETLRAKRGDNYFFLES